MKNIEHIAVVGLGQIGGSIVLALRKSNAPVRITGIDVSRKLLQLLGKHLDETSDDWKAAENAQLIIICLHYGETIQFLKKVQTSALLMDVCSAKRKVVAAANHRRLRFIGAHPMAGNEMRMEKGWDENLFHDAPFFLCPAENSSRADLWRVKQIVALLHAKPVPVDPAMHDRCVAISSHVPALLSAIYRDFSAEVPPLFHGPGYRSFTRLSNTSPELLRTFLDGNGDEIHRAWKLWMRFVRESVRNFR